MALDLASPVAAAVPTSDSKAKRNIVVFLVALLVFITESTFRTRKFQVSIALDWQVALQLAVWGIAGIAGMLLGALSSRNLRRAMVAYFALFLFWMVLSAGYAPHPVRMTTLASAVGFVTFLVFAVGVADHLTERQAWCGLAAGLALDVLSAPILYYSHHEPGAELAESTDSGRMHGFLSHSAELGTDAALLTIVALLIASRSERPRRWWLLAAVSFVIIILSTGKTGLIALAGSGALIWWRRNAILTALTPIWVFAAGALGVLIATVGLQGMIPNDILRLISRTGRAADALTLTGRTKIWDFAIDRWEMRPFFGFGWNSGRYIINGYFQGWTILQFHSMYLNCLVYLGVVGLLTFTVVVLYRVVAYFRAPDFSWDWIFLFILIEGLAEQGALSDKPSVHSFAFVLCLMCFARRSPALTRASPDPLTAATG